MTSAYSLFKTSSDLEKKGVKLEYTEDMYFIIARAGGENKEYSRVLESLLRPYESQVRSGIMPNELAEKLFKEVYARSIVKNWGSKKYGEGKIEGENGKEFSFSVENCIKLFNDLPLLFQEIKDFSENFKNYKYFELEKDLKN